jgi:tetratricopeptide (TPR) repeat protein
MIPRTIEEKEQSHGHEPIWKRLGPPLLIVVIGAVVYSDSFPASFVWDDVNDIVRNEKVREFWTAFVPDSDGPWRPIVAFSFYLNHRLGGEEYGYHAVNLVIHLIAGLTLYGLVRRTLLLERFHNRFESAATWLALAVALVWTVHPLQTEAVTYIVHRYESLMSMFYLLTLYCVLRGATAPGSQVAWFDILFSGRPMSQEDRSAKWRQFGWYLAAVVFCALGMGSKEVMVTAPLMVLVYDRMFLAGSWRELLKSRWVLYIGLAATYPIVGIPLTLALSSKVTWAGFDNPIISKVDYWRSEPGVVLYYLRLAFWPDALCFDYGWPKAEGADWALPMLVILALVIATTIALFRGHALGFVGAWFFGVLSVTLIMPLADLAAERRMYLALAAVCLLVVLGGYEALEWARRRWSWNATTCYSVGAGLVLLAVFALGARTLVRNLDYYTEEQLWRDVARQRPNNYRAHSNLGAMLIRRQQYPEAIEALDRAIELRPDAPYPFRFKGIALQAMGRHQEALACYEEAVRRNPGDAQTHNLLGMEYRLFGNGMAAAMHYQQAIRLKPKLPDPHNNLGALYLDSGKLDEARQEFMTVVQLNPEHAGAYVNLGTIQWRLGDPEGALRYWQRGLQRAPARSSAAASAHLQIGVLRALQGNWDEAIPHLEAALEANPRFADAHDKLGEHLAEQGKLDEALKRFETAALINPRSARFQNHRGSTLLHLGKTDAAVEALTEASRLDSKDYLIRCNLGDALVAQGKPAEALKQYQEALRLNQRWPEEARVGAWSLATNPDANRRSSKRALQLARRVVAVAEAPTARDLDILAAAFAEAGQFDDAVANAEKALALARANSQAELADQIEKRLMLYRMTKPYREAGK